MSWIQEHWQSVAALVVVGVTALVFLKRLLRRGKKSCGSGCDCPTKTVSSKSDS